MTLGLVVLFIGALLVESAIRDEHPWCPILTAFGRPCPPKPGGDSPLSVMQSVTQTIVGQATAGADLAGANKLVAAFDAALVKKFPHAQNAGICACRKIIPHDGGTSDIWSQHAWCNAVDWRADPATMAAIMRWAAVNAARFKIANIIGPGSAVAVVHVDFLPTRTGTPPCASSGGGP